MSDPSTSPEHKVAMASFALQTAVSDLWRMRLANDTADLVVAEEGTLLAVLGSLYVLTDDIRQSLDKREAVSPSLAAAE